MPSSFTTWGATAVLGAQLLLPPLLAWRAWFIEDPNRESADGDSRSRVRSRGRPRGAATKQPMDRSAVALTCTQCASPVPLLAATFPCPACGALVTPPEAYAGALAAAAETERTLARAERVWLWSRVWTSLPVVWLGRLLLVGWLVVVVAAAVVCWGTWLSALVPCAVTVALVQCILGAALFSSLRELRAQIPPLPARAELEAPAELGSCAGCGSPFEFAANRLSAVCGYCTAVQYRRALAQDAMNDAVQAARGARCSLLDGIRALDTKRFELAGVTVLTGIAVVFYGVLFGLGSLMELL